jgi:thiosulfate sulfurtransferase
MQSISVPELALWRNANYPHTLIDVRRKLRREEDGVEIADGQWFDPALWLEWKDKVAATDPVVIYCAQGHEISQGLSAALRAMGIDSRYLLGGLEAWRSAGHRVEPIKSYEQLASTV